MNAQSDSGATLSTLRAHFRDPEKESVCIAESLPPSSSPPSSPRHLPTPRPRPIRAHGSIESSKRSCALFIRSIRSIQLRRNRRRVTPCREPIRQPLLRRAGLPLAGCLAVILAVGFGAKAVADERKAESAFDFAIRHNLPAYGFLTAVRHQVRGSSEHDDHTASVAGFDDDRLFGVWSFTPRGIGLTLTNKTDGVVAIRWREVSFISAAGNAHRVMHQGQSYLTRYADSPDTIVAPGAKIDDVFVPADSVSIEYGRLEIAPLVEALNIGSEAKVLMPIAIGDVIHDYLFTFAIRPRADDVAAAKFADEHPPAQLPPPAPPQLPAGLRLGMTHREAFAVLGDQQGEMLQANVNGIHYVDYYSRKMGKTLRFDSRDQLVSVH